MARKRRQCKSLSPQTQYPCHFKKKKIISKWRWKTNICILMGAVKILSSMTIRLSRGREGKRKNFMKKPDLTFSFFTSFLWPNKCVFPSPFIVVDPNRFFFCFVSLFFYSCWFFWPFVTWIKWNDAWTIALFDKCMSWMVSESYLKCLCFV